jgi:hypothetical protein
LSELLGCVKLLVRLAGGAQRRHKSAQRINASSEPVVGAFSRNGLCDVSIKGAVGSIAQVTAVTRASLDYCIEVFERLQDVLWSNVTETE